MARNLFLALAGLVAVMLVPAFAEDKKADAKMEGTLVCTKCKLKETEKCGHALIVTGKDKKEVTYYIKDNGAKEAYHKDCCMADVPATVTGGKVVEKDGKKTVEGGKVEVSKKEKK
ncbi:MAG: hypothetical protein MUF18_03135 [Fimbriiglobus sp.]|jgi:hypothetical protein|nr:hypothetical protein [Fimbriiglobus sp.]